MINFKSGKTKSFLIAFAAVTAAANVAYANEYTTVTFAGKNGEQTVVPCDGMIIAFDAGQIKVSHTNGQSLFQTADMASFFFSNNETAIETITKVEDVQVSVFTPDGKPVGIFNSTEEARINLPQGVYIYKSYDTTGKFIVK